MTGIFLFCSLVGGTFLVCQFVMTLLGIGGTGFDGTIGHDLPDATALHIPDAWHGDVAVDGHGVDSHGSSWLFGIISFRTLVAAMTFFGLAGMVANSSGLAVVPQLLIALASGGAAMCAVHWLVRGMYRLSQSGTLRLTNAIGNVGTVSISIPGRSAGQGKVRLTVQGRLEEFAAVTAKDCALSTGAQVIVVDVVDDRVLEVEPLHPTS
jgi:hypothetical protein